MISLEKTDSIINDHFKHLLTQYMSGSLLELSDQCNKEKEKEYNNLNLKFIFVCSLAILLSMLIVLICYIFYNHRKNILEKRICAIEDLENAMDKYSVILDVFKKGYGTFDSLCKSYYGKGNTDVDKKKAITMKNVVSVIKSKSKTAELSKAIDLAFNNLMSDFVKDLSSANVKDRRLFMFSILGFSSSSIALFLNESSVENVYNRKRHLKDKIKELPTDKQNRYLSYLS